MLSLLFSSISFDSFTLYTLGLGYLPLQNSPRQRPQRRRTVLRSMQVQRRGYQAAIPGAVLSVHSRCYEATCIWYHGRRRAAHGIGAEL